MSSPSKDYIAAYYRALYGFSRRCEAELTILLYHGVSQTKSRGIENYAHKHVPADDFADHLRFLKRNCTVLSLDEVVALHNAGATYPKKSVAITFDDGFANNHDVAAPILDDFDLPATFYISTGVINTDLMFWVDILEDSLNRTEVEEISVPLNGLDQTFDLSDQDRKLVALDVIKGACKRLPVEAKDEILDVVQAQTGITAEIGETENYRKMTWKQVRELDRNQRFIVGGHSLYHDILGLQTPARADLDIRTSIDLLAYQTGRVQTHYSYPEGQPHHYNEANIQTLTDKGIVCAPSALAGLNPVGTDLYHLRRIMVGFYGLPMPFNDPRLVN